MRSLLLTLVSLALTLFRLQANEPVLINYTISEKPYRFSTYFEMQSEGEFFGMAVKSKFSIVRPYYTLYDSKGQKEAYAIGRMLSLGALYNWAKEFDVYDPYDQWIGMIDGQAMTTSQAKFSLYNRENKRVGIAYLNFDSTSFAIVHPENDKRLLAHLKRNFILGILDTWDVKIYHPEAFDLRILKVFSTFAIDYQEFFKEDR